MALEDKQHGVVSKQDDRKGAILAVLVIVVTCFALYGRMANHDFITLDDPVYVTGNPNVKAGLTMEGIKWAFTTFHAEFYHPVVWLSLMADTKLYGGVPGGYLFTNLVIHVLNSLFVFYFFELATRRLWESFLVAALFAIHPLHVEAVAWISERKELLGAFFWFASMLAYYGYSKRPGIFRYLTVFVLFSLGIVSKPMVVTLPLALLLLDYWPLERDREVAGGNRASLWLRLFAEKVPLLLLSAAGSVLAVVAQQHGQGLISTEKFPIGARVANSLISYAAYLRKTLWPVDLAVIYPLYENLEMRSAIVPLVVLAALTSVCLLAGRRKRWAAVGWLWFVGTLVPVIGIVKIGNFSMADRYTYIPLVGIFAAAAFGLGELTGRLKRAPVFRAAVVVAIFFAYLPMTYLQVGTWKDSGTLYSHALDVTKGNYLVHYSLGNFLASHGRFNEAIRHFRRAVSLRPQNGLFAISLGKALAATGRWDEAKHFFFMAQKDAPQSPLPHFFIGCALAAENEVKGAISNFAEAMAKDEILAFQGDPQRMKEAKRFFDAGKRAASHGNRLEAERLFKRALAIAPCHRQAAQSLALLYLASGDSRRALAVYGVPCCGKELAAFTCRGYERWQGGFPCVGDRSP